MYKVFCDGNMICDSRIEELALLDPVVNLEENKAGSFSFSLPPAHPFYDAVRRRKSVVQVYQNGELLFSGICMESTDSFYRQRKIFCEGELTYLNDSIQRPKNYKGMTVRGLLEAYIASHNSQVEEKKQFAVGMVTATDSNDYITCFTNMENTMKAIKEDLVDDLGGIVRARHKDGIKYIDYLADSINTNSQVIKIGKNLLDFTKNIDASGFATAIIPQGVKLEESAVEGLDTRLTIESVNGGVDYVYNAESVAAYGWIYRTVVWDNVTTPEALKAKAEKYLAETQFENMVIEAKAVDLHLTDKDIERFKLSDQIRVLSAPHGLDKYFRLTKMMLYLNNPEKNMVTLGKDEAVALSAKSNKENAEIKKAIEVIPNTVLQSAKENATQLIHNATNGYIVLVMNEDETPKELLIMDTNDKETATRVWRWNVNGLGYSKDGYDGEYGLAMTMDGAIVADRITAGTMYADRIKGGTLTLGGASNINGVLKILNDKNVEVGRWDKDGIVLPPGTTISWAAVTDTENVANKADIPSKVGELENDSKYITSEVATQITKDTVTTSYVNALKITAWSVNAENITGTTISGKRILGENVGMNSYEKDGWAIYAGEALEGAVEPYTDQCILNIGHGGEMYAQTTTLKYLRMEDRCAAENARIDFIYSRGSSYPLSTGTAYQGSTGLFLNSDKDITLTAEKDAAIWGENIFLRGTVTAQYSVIHQQSADFYSLSTIYGALYADEKGMNIQSRNGKNLDLYSDSGVIIYTGTLQQNSSKRYKDNISEIPQELSKRILELVAKEYDYISTGKHTYGFIAEEVIKILPELVGLDEYGRPDSVSYMEMIPLIIMELADIVKRLVKIERGDYYG